MSNSRRIKRGLDSPSSKGFLVSSIIVLVTFFVASAVMTLLFNPTHDVSNLATVIPRHSMWSSRTPQQPSPNPDSTLGDSRKMFADARSTDEIERKRKTPRVNNYNPDLSNIEGLDLEFFKDFSQEGGKQGYYYYDSSTQVFYLHHQYAKDKPKSYSGKYKPSLCNDGQTVGFTDLVTLRNAIQELNDAYSNAVSCWKHYNGALADYENILDRYAKYKTFSAKINQVPIDVEIQTPTPLPDHIKAILEDEPDPFVICPHAILKAPLARHITIHINAEDVQLLCDSCVIDTPGTHISFGKHAKDILVKGLTLMGATETSILLRENGADVIFEECYWVNNESGGMYGTVADMNSTSTVKFYRCEISDTQVKNIRPGMISVPNNQATSFTVRT